eukprot:scaffold34490_cov47-Prasinocladus_malaysianus.AAC.2
MHPWVAQCVLHRNSSLRIFRQQFRHKVPGLAGDHRLPCRIFELRLERPDVVHYLPYGGLGGKWREAAQHDVQNHPAGPHVDLFAVAETRDRRATWRGRVSWSEFKHLWSQIHGRPADLVKRVRYAVTM